MNVAIIGYGKMGKEVEKILSERGHVISKIIDIETHNMDLGNSDIAIIFSAPKSVYKHIINCLDSKIAVVCGSTGWTDKLDDTVNYCKSLDGTFIFSPNFSIGVNLFFKLNNFLAKIMKNHSNYKLEILEKHHIEKVDKPSGTAIKLANDIILNSNYSDWAIDNNTNQNRINIKSIREGEIKGYHEVEYLSENDSIKICHNANNRYSFAYGAVLSAEFIFGKKGVFSLDDVINNLKI
tara:strand:- start:94 stop:804 length:711 start_codon:yes stop_codon:yes gene_type:complete